MSKEPKLLVMTSPGKDNTMDYRATNDYRVATLAGPGRVVGGLTRGSGELADHKEVVENLFDGNNATKWLDPAGASFQRPAWAEYRLMPEAPAVVLTQYLVTSANDHPERDPAEWVLEGLAEADDREDTDEDCWLILDYQKAPTFRRRKQTVSFPTTLHVPCRRFRLRITRTAQPNAMVQLCGLDLFSNPTAPEHPGARLSAYRPPVTTPLLHGSSGPLGMTVKLGQPPVKLQGYRGSWVVGGATVERAVAHPIPVSEEFPAWVEWRVQEGSPPPSLASYSFFLLPDGDVQKSITLTSLQAPRSWVLEGQPAALGARAASADTWLPLDRQAGIKISPLDAGQPMEFPIKIQIPCSRFRLKITAAQHPAGPGVAISAVQLLAHPPTQAPDPSQGTPAGASPSSWRPMAATAMDEWPGTEWRPALDSDLDDEIALQGRLYGGWCRASDELAKHKEVAENVFDGTQQTKWLDPGGGSPSRPAWVEYRLAPDVEGVVVGHYSVVTANDHPERDPQDWILEGWVVGEEVAMGAGQGGEGLAAEMAGVKIESGDGGGGGGEGGEGKTIRGAEGEVVVRAGVGGGGGVGEKGRWVVLNEQRAVKWVARFQESYFKVGKRVKCKAFRWRVEATAQPACFLQVACLNLFVMPQ